jgi:hypothetical protein
MAHDLITRQIRELKGYNENINFITCSNDETIKIWSYD